MLGARLSAGSIGRRTYRRMVSPDFFDKFHVGTYLFGHFTAGDHSNLRDAHGSRDQLRSCFWFFALHRLVSG